MTPEQALLDLFCSNFMAYYKAHAAHVNIVGRNFYSDHKQLQKIYEDLQAEIDTIAEFLRTLEAEMPLNLSDTMLGSMIPDNLQKQIEDDGLDFIESTYQDLETLIDIHQDLEEACEDREYNHIANYAQDRVRVLNKFCWQLRSTLAK
jgi:DNA-binding ferritin-like protein